ncbi:TPA: hypothetical protein NQO92_000387 [Pseudomonas aeruginosa]|uniref:hypothetical protein n=1 Tax=Pseudomonas aeruginosa TaxID=287 RepID=UPI0029A298D8|nr:hypothetical protein [Pseudomonas aeruginosa]HCH7787136.1 hypothetical protein [Pseudomonas aeruginosa]HCH9902951.1 hypothetical protein [Pseudomonas aeruginosa]HCH9953978.1 hypothetical protein [Pseudomonas aeruginosa]HCI3563648.1 hypothetical protein [Pseudomonas aeruginosa]
MQQQPPANQGVDQHAARPVLSTYEVASGLAKWCISRGLIQALSPEIDQASLANVPAISLPTDAENVLRHRGIESISYSSVSCMIYIYTTRKVTQKELKSLPASLQRQGISYPHGRVDDVGKGQLVSQGATYSIHQNAAGTFYACGSSISPGNDASAGTMGALVRLTDGTICGLTNNHVSALCSHVELGTPILAPGVADVRANSLDPFTIGHHIRALEMHHGSVGNINIAANTDAAIFRLVNAASCSSMQGNHYDTPVTIVDPSEGMKVAKVGRTTGLTHGQIVSRELRPAGVNYHAQSYGFSSMMWFTDVFTIHGNGSEFSAGGDSGSLVVQVDANSRPVAAIGLIFAGGPDSSAPGGAKSLMLPLRPMLTALGATLIGGHNA